MPNTITLQVTELNRISSVLSQFFPDEKGCTSITISSNSLSGLGKVVTVSFPYEIDGIKGTFSHEVVNEDDW